MHSETELIYFLVIGFSRLLAAALFTVVLFVPLVYAITISVSRKKWLVKKKLFLMQVAHDNEMLRMQIETQEQTFRNISADIHDNIGQQLSLAHFYGERLSETGVDASHITVIIRNAIADLRDLSYSLSADLIEDEGLIVLIKRELAQLNKVNKIVIEFTEVGEPVYLDPDTATILYRIFQEAIQNILKHARATKIKVSACVEGDEFTLVIADNGKGIAANAVDGRGFKNMRSRLKILAGTLKIDSDYNGTSIIIKTPLNNEKY